MRVVLVVGFGPFLEVVDNPSARLARAVDGRLVGVRVVGREIPVSWTRSVETTVALARSLDPVAVIGIGVARGRTEPWVERRAVRVAEGADVDGVADPELRGPDEVTLDDRLAAALGVGVSEDAGRYVCNGWMYQARQALDCDVAFVHLPMGGLDPERLVDGIRRVWELGASA